MQSAIHDLSWYSAVYLNNDNAKLLEKYMTATGMRGLSSEWWHFQDDETREAIGLSSYLFKGVNMGGWTKDDQGWRYRDEDGSVLRDTTFKADGNFYTADQDGYVLPWRPFPDERTPRKPVGFRGGCLSYGIRLSGRCSRSSGGESPPPGPGWPRRRGSAARRRCRWPSRCRWPRTGRPWRRRTRRTSRGRCSGPPAWRWSSPCSGCTGTGRWPSVPGWWGSWAGRGPRRCPWWFRWRRPISPPSHSRTRPPRRWSPGRRRRADPPAGRGWSPAGPG